MRFILLLSLALSLSAVALQAQSKPAEPSSVLIRKVVANELQAATQDHTHWMYRSVALVPPPKKTKIVVETRQGDVTLLTGIGDRPLDAQQSAAADKRMQSFISDPDQLEKARKSSQSDDQKSAQLLKILPDAFLFTYAGTDGDKIRLTFVPNPNFTSHSSQAYVLHKMEGFVLVNEKSDRLIEMSGHLTQRVEFLGGLLGHLDAGGVFDVRHEAVAPDHWAVTRLKVNMTGKILFFKTISEQQDELHSDFKRVADTTTLPEAAAMARKNDGADQKQ